MKELKLGKGLDMFLSDPLDSWVSSAKGSSARVFRGSLISSNGLRKMKAIKIMRPDKLDYALPLFLEEIVILQTMKGVLGVADMHEYGLIKLDRESKIPKDDTQDTAKSLTGLYIEISADEILDSAFLEQKAIEGWLPYMALDLKSDSNNLLWHCDPSRTNGRYFSVENGVQASKQICDLLAIAHAKNIVYLDHKILHYYWNGEHTSLIDWNVGHKFSNFLSDDDRGFDIVQLGARTLYFMFTGRQPEGALTLGPTRPEEIQAAPHSYVVDWKYDDRRLPDSLKQLLQVVLAGGYFNAAKLSDDFGFIAERLR